MIDRDDPRTECYFRVGDLRAKGPVGLTPHNLINVSCGDGDEDLTWREAAALAGVLAQAFPGIIHVTIQAP